MKKVVTTVIASTFALALAFGYVNVSEAKVKVFKNCTEVHKTYKGGIARYSTTKNKGGKTYYKPYVSKSLYDANKRLDRDKDLIACER